MNVIKKIGIYVLLIILLAATTIALTSSISPPNNLNGYNRYTIKNYVIINGTTGQFTNLSVSNLNVTEGFRNFDYVVENQGNITVPDVKIYSTASQKYVYESTNVDTSIVINQLFDALVDGDSVLFREGIYRTNATEKHCLFDVREDNLYFVGEGRGTTLYWDIIDPVPGGHELLCFRSDGGRITNMRLMGRLHSDPEVNEVNQTPELLDVSGADFLIADNLWLENAYEGLNMDNTKNSIFSNIHIKNTEHGVRIRSGATGNTRNLFFNNIDISRVWNNSLNGTTGAGYLQDGVKITGGDHIVFDGLSCKGGTRTCIHFLDSAETEPYAWLFNNVIIDNQNIEQYPTLNVSQTGIGIGNGYDLHFSNLYYNEHSLANGIGFYVLADGNLNMNDEHHIFVSNYFTDYVAYPFWLKTEDENITDVYLSDSVLKVKVDNVDPDAGVALDQGTSGEIRNFFMDNVAVLADNLSFATDYGSGVHFRSGADVKGFSIENCFLEAQDQGFYIDGSSSGVNGTFKNNRVVATDDINPSFPSSAGLISYRNNLLNNNEINDIYFSNPLLNWNKIYMGNTTDSSYLQSGTGIENLVLVGHRGTVKFQTWNGSEHVSVGWFTSNGTNNQGWLSNGTEALILNVPMSMRNNTLEDFSAEVHNLTVLNPPATCSAENSFLTAWTGAVGTCTSINDTPLNVNHSSTCGTATTWDGETSQADLNVNDTSYWDGLDTPSDILISDLDQTGEANLNTNSSDYWDNLGSPSDINAADITDDNTYVTVTGDTITGKLIIDQNAADYGLHIDMDGVETALYVESLQETIGHFRSTNAYPSLNLEGYGTGQHEMISLRNGSTQMAVIGLDENNGIFTIGGATISNDYFVVDIIGTNAGYVGIGTITPTSKLQVVGTINATGYASDGGVGMTATVTVRDGGGAADCNLVYADGLLISTTCTTS